MAAIKFIVTERLQPHFINQISALRQEHPPIHILNTFSERILSRSLKVDPGIDAWTSAGQQRQRWLDRGCRIGSGTSDELDGQVRVSLCRPWQLQLRIEVWGRIRQ